MACPPRKSKVNDAYVIRRRHQDVLRLQVPVHDPMHVAMLNRTEYLLQIPHRLLLTELIVVLLAANFFEELLSGHELHHEVDVLRIIVRLEVPDDVRVVKPVQ